MRICSSMLLDSKMCDRAVDIHPSIIQLVVECYITYEKYYKSVNRCIFVFNSIPDQNRT